MVTFSLCAQAARPIPSSWPDTEKRKDGQGHMASPLAHPLKHFPTKQAPQAPSP